MQMCKVEMCYHSCKTLSLLAFFLCPSKNPDTRTYLGQVVDIETDVHLDSILLVVQLMLSALKRFDIDESTVTCSSSTGFFILLQISTIQISKMFCSSDSRR